MVAFSDIFARPGPVDQRPCQAYPATGARARPLTPVPAPGRSHRRHRRTLWPAPTPSRFHRPRPSALAWPPSSARSPGCFSRSSHLTASASIRALAWPLHLCLRLAAAVFAPTPDRLYRRPRLIASTDALACATLPLPAPGRLYRRRLQPLEHLRPSFHVLTDRQRQCPLSPIGSPEIAG